MESTFLVEIHAPDGAAFATVVTGTWEGEGPMRCCVFAEPLVVTGGRSYAFWELSGEDAWA